MRVSRFLQRLRILLGAIKFSHSVFALPFGLMALFIAERGIPRGSIVLWVMLAMVGARTAAMAFNRLVDARIDAENPRTAQRDLPQGRVSRLEMWLLVVSGSTLFLTSAVLLNGVAAAFAPFVLLFLLSYSWTKRFTAWCHVVLGASLGISPMGAWVASRGSDYLDQWWIPTGLGIVVLLWTAGFDIIYSCQDYRHDLTRPLHSVPKRFGIRGALMISSTLHIGTMLLLLLVGWAAQLSLVYFGGVAAVGGLLFYEHRIVRPDDLSRVDTAFLTLNGLVSVVLFLATVVDLIVLPS